MEHAIAGARRATERQAACFSIAPLALCGRELQGMLGIHDIMPPLQIPEI